MTTNDAVRPVATLIVYAKQPWNPGDDGASEYHFSGPVPPGGYGLYPPSAIAHLQARVEALQKSLDQLTGMKFSDRMHAALVSRAEAAERRVAEILGICRERDSAHAAWNSLTGADRQYPGPEYKRSRQADDRYAALFTQPEADHA